MSTYEAYLQYFLSMPSFIIIDINKGIHAEEIMWSQADFSGKNTISNLTEKYIFTVCLWAKHSCSNKIKITIDNTWFCSSIH